MSKKYRELVALQVTFSKVTGMYRLVHHYRLVTREARSGPVSIESFDLNRHAPIKEIAASLRNAYAPAVLTVWALDETASTSELLQFEPGADPEDLRLDGTWSVWAEL